MFLLKNKENAPAADNPKALVRVRDFFGKCGAGQGMHAEALAGAGNLGEIQAGNGTGVKHNADPFLRMIFLRVHGRYAAILQKEPEKVNGNAAAGMAALSQQTIEKEKDSS